jgi:hypothetical protein
MCEECERNKFRHINDKEMEITPAMLKAGEDAFDDTYDPDEPGNTLKVIAAVFSAMLRVYPSHSVHE